MIELLLGEKIKFNLGLHMVKCRSQSDLDMNLSLQASVEKEMLYFSSRKPWDQIEDRSFFGTVALREKLAAVQIAILKTSIPAIRQEIALKKKEAETKLEQLGTDMNSPHLRRQVFLDCLSKVNGVVCNHVMHADGAWRSTTKASLQSEILQRLNAFKDSILSSQIAHFSEKAKGTKVNVYVNGASYFGSISKMKGNFCNVQLDDYELSTHVGGSSYIAGHSYELPSNAKKLKGNGQVKSLKGVDVVFHKMVLYDVKIEDAMCTVDEILMDQIVLNNSGELPTFASPQVFKLLVENYTSEWGSAVETLLADLSLILLAFMDWALTSMFPDILPELRGVMTQKAHTFLQNQMSLLTRLIQDLRRNEQKPSTLNNYLIETVHKMRLQPLQQLLDSIEGTIIDKRIIEGFISKHHGTSNNEYLAEEMRIALSAYGKVASKRFIDNVEQAVKIQGVVPLCNMFKELLAVTDAELDSFMKEKPGVAGERRKWRDKLDKMEKAAAALEGLQ